MCLLVQFELKLIFYTIQNDHLVGLFECEKITAFFWSGISSHENFGLCLAFAYSTAYYLLFFQEPAFLYCPNIGY